MEDQNRIIPKKTKQKIMVVKELPTQEIREYTDKDGTKVKIMTTEEYLTELANS